MLGALHFWRLAIRPGRPVAFGTLAGKAFLGLPGNPVAMMVTFLRFARPVLLRLAGATDVVPHMQRVRTAADIGKKAGRREWLRVKLAAGDDGIPVAHKFPRDGAGILTSLVESDGLIELDEDTCAVPAGSLVDFLPYTEVAQ
jgi:molybdopterin molybdotransferase